MRGLGHGNSGTDGELYPCKSVERHDRCTDAKQFEGGVFNLCAVMPPEVVEDIVKYIR